MRVAIPLLLCLSLLAVACGPRRDEEFAYRGNVVRPPFEMPDVTLTDTAGEPFNLRERTSGRVTLLYLGYTHCPDVCPTHFGSFTAALDDLDPSVRDAVDVVFISTDPERDTPERLRTWLDHFDTRYVGLRASEDATIAALDAFGFPAPERVDLISGGYSVTHAEFVIAFTGDGTGRLTYPAGTLPDDWAHDLPRLIEESWD